MTPTVQIRPMLSSDWDAVERIYAEGIATGSATFEPQTPTWEYFDRVRNPEYRFVALIDNQVVGWVATSSFSARAVYAGVLELSVYVSSAAHGRGVGRALLEKLIESTEAAGIWTLNSTIFPQNAGSLKLHEKLGFRVIGRREKIARIGAGPNKGKWQDVVILERRSKKVGWEEESMATG